MIEQIQAIIPIPDNPIDIDEDSLQTTQSKLGIEFPADFLDYVRIYGSGTIVIGDVYDIEIYSPARKSFQDFVTKFADRQDRYRKATGNEGLPLGLYPEPGGLLPFGHRDDIYFSWKTLGTSDNWPIVVIWQYEPGGFQEFSLGFCTFLIELLTGNIRITPFRSVWNEQAEIQFETEVYGG